VPWSLAHDIEIILPRKKGLQNSLWECVEVSKCTSPPSPNRRCMHTISHLKGDILFGKRGLPCIRDAEIWCRSLTQGVERWASGLLANISACIWFAKIAERFVHNFPLSRQSILETTPHFYSVEEGLPFYSSTYEEYRLPYMHWRFEIRVWELDAYEYHDGVSKREKGIAKRGSFLDYDQMAVRYE